ncbi:phage holin, lambda family [Enterobacter roggenkampii]|uniref:phage holin, lambda family n=1 Tax=Enterobacter roggenkampii TaxID=1812935 RepID=UPI0008DDB4BE|nr:phage holin, lambda family [Enterobacter roggenkampii]OHY42636.1 phage holin, lambda family [Enterobacter roggenkampii]OHY58824.1 phage holin, lambda family [Enterobacter roggenkampii]
MHDTPPGLLEQTMKWIATYLPTLYAAGAALSISALMSIYDGQSIVKTATGSLVCGIVTLAVAGSLEYFGLPSNAAIFVGASIGLMGADKVRSKVSGLFDARFGGPKSGNEQ